MVKTKTKRILVLMLTFLMVFMQMVPSFVVAEGETTEETHGETQEVEAIVEETTEVEEPDKVVTEVDEVVLEDQVEEDVTLETEEAEENAPPVEELTINEKLVAKLDFSNGRLIVKTDEKVFTDSDPVIASLDGVYILQYEDEEHAKDAYTRFVEAGVDVEVDSTFSISDDETVLVNGEETEVTPVDESSMMTEEENPFTEAEQVKTDRVQYDVAVIDTGANNADKIVSVLGDNGSDNHGHGQKMIDIIKDIAPDAKVLSIKAISDNGTGDVSAVYAAIKLAIEEDVKIINLSISAPKTNDTSIIEEAINEAVEKGIVVVGAAGNNKKNAENYIPGSIEKATVVGACDSTGKVISNSGDTVDYYMPAQSSSEAAAKVVGYTINGEDIAKVIEGILNTVEEPTEENNEEESTETKTVLPYQYISETKCYYDEAEFIKKNDKFYIDNDALPNGHITVSIIKPSDDEISNFEYQIQDGNFIERQEDTIEIPADTKFIQIYNDVSEFSINAENIEEESTFTVALPDGGNLTYSGTGYRFANGQLVAYFIGGYRAYCMDAWRDDGLGMWHSLVGDTQLDGEAKLIGLAVRAIRQNSEFSDYRKAYREAMAEAYIYYKTGQGSTVSGYDAYNTTVWNRAEAIANQEMEDWEVEAKIYSTGNSYYQRMLVFDYKKTPRPKTPEILRVEKVNQLEQNITGGSSSAVAKFEVTVNPTGGGSRTFIFKTLKANEATAITPAGWVNFNDPACLVSGTPYSKPSNVNMPSDMLYYPPGTVTFVETEAPEGFVLQRAYPITYTVADDLTISTTFSEDRRATLTGETAITRSGIKITAINGQYKNYEKGSEDNIVLFKIKEVNGKKTVISPDEARFIFKVEVFEKGTSTSGRPDATLYFTQHTVHSQFLPDGEFAEEYSNLLQENGITNPSNTWITFNRGVERLVPEEFPWNPSDKIKLGDWTSSDYYKVDPGHIAYPDGAKLRITEVYTNNKDYQLSDDVLWAEVKYDDSIKPTVVDNQEYLNNYHIFWTKDTLSNAEDFKHLGDLAVKGQAESGGGETLIRVLGSSFTNYSTGNLQIFKNRNADYSFCEYNSLYNIKEGAKFEIYPTREDARARTSGKLIQTLTTDANGATPVSIDLVKGKYYVREVVAPKGFKLNAPATAKGEDADPSIKEVTVESGKTAEVDFENPPILDNKGVNLIKSGKHGDAPIENTKEEHQAIFKIEHWDNDAGNVSGATKKVWYFRTKIDDVTAPFPGAPAGKQMLLDTKDGHTFLPSWTDEDGVKHTSSEVRYDFLLGTYRVTEVQPPTGYKIVSSNTFTYVLKQDGNNLMKTYVVPSQDFIEHELTDEFKETPIYGDVYIEKVDKNMYSDFGDRNTEPAGDADLTGIEFTIKYTPTADDQPKTELQDGTVIENGWTYKVYTEKRVVNGKDVYYAETTGKYLPGGTYTIQETKTNDKYLLTDGQPHTFSITSDGQVYKFDATQGNDEPAQNMPKQGTIIAKKILKETNTNTNGDAITENIKFAIVNKSLKGIIINRGNKTTEQRIPTGYIADIITTGADGISNESTKLDYGTYEVIELKRNSTAKVGDQWTDSLIGASSEKYSNNKGVLWESNKNTIKVYNHEQQYSAGDRTFEGEKLFDNNTNKHDLDVIKVDTQMVTAQGDASFAGIRYALVNKSKYPAEYEDVIYPVGSVMDVLTVDTNGKVTSKEAPYGTYDLIELRLDAEASETMIGKAWNSVNKGTSVYANDNGYLYKAKTVTVQVREQLDNEDIKAEYDNMPVEGGVKLRKVDEDRNVTDKETNKPQGDALLGNGSTSAEISIYNISDKTVVNKDNKQIVSGKSAIDVAGRTGYADTYLVQKIYTNAQGIATTGATDLPYGTYVAIETDPSRGHFNNDDWYVVFQVREQGVIIDVNETESVEVKKGKDSKSGWTSSDGTVGTSVKQALSEKIYRGGVNVQKLNEELDAAHNQGDTTLEGIKFNIVNASLQDVYVEGKWYGHVEDKFYDGMTKKNNLDENIYENSVRTVTNITRTELINAKNAVGGNGAVVKTLVTDKFGFDETELNTLPYGTYYMYESEPNSSYLLTDKVIRFEVREDNKLVDTKPEMDEVFKVKKNDEVAFFNNPVRGDIYFSKVNEDGVRRPNTPFLLAQLDRDGNIIEAHVIVTDKNGIASTAYTFDTLEENGTLEVTQAERKHTNNTNGFDQYVKKNADGSYSVTDAGETVLASGEASTWGVWFGQGLHPETGKIVKNSISDADDSVGALPYGTYQLFEIQCKENKDLGEDLLIGEPFKITRKNTTLNSNGDVVKEESRNERGNAVRYADTFVDLEVLITSKAKDALTGTQVALMGDEDDVRKAELTDTVSFSNVKATSTYKWVFTFAETESGNILSTVEVDNFKPEKVNNAVQTTNQPEYAFTISTAGTISKVVDEYGTVNKSYVGEPTVTSTGNVDLTGLDGKSISVTVELYEYITGYDYDNEDDYKEFTALNFIKSHNVERKDENQKIYIPKMETTAMDIFTKDHVGTKYNIGENYDDISKTDAIVDTVKMWNLDVKEKYMLVEYLWDATENKRYSDEEQTYSWYSDRDKVRVIEEHTVEMKPFTVDSKDFAEKTLVVMEELWRVDDAGNKYDEIPVITHKSKVDENQSVHYIDIETKLLDEKTEDHVGTVAKKITLTDTVTLRNLVKDMEYLIKGELVYQADCTDVNGNKHKAGDPVPVLEGSVTEVTYKATEYGDAEVQVSYVVDSTLLEGLDVVSTEYAYHNDILIDKHVDLEDKTQTVEFPKIRTKAADGKTSDDVGTVMEDGTLIDTVQLWNLIEGEEYTVDGTLVYQEDGTPVEGVKSEPVTFIATADQTEYTEVEIKFTNIDATKLAGKSVVVFEKLFHPNENTGEPVEVNRHEDLTDKGQTVHFPSIRTKAVDKRTGDQVGSIFGQAINKIRQFFGGNVADDDQIEIVDTVILGNLVPGRTYTIKGVLMDQDTNELLTGKEITATATITVGEGTITGSNGETTTVAKWDEEHNSVSGTVDLTFRLGTEEVTDKTVVVFEKLMHNDVEVNRHEDINDRAQFVNLIDVDSTAIDANTGNHVGDVPGSTLDTAKIVETFNMRKLVNGEDYKVDFALLVREESEKQGKPIYLAKDGTFTPNREEAINSILDATALAEKEAFGWRVIVNGEELFVGETQDEAQAYYANYLAGLAEEDKANAEVYLIEKFNEMIPDEDAFSAGAQMVVEFDIDKDTVAGYTIVVVADVYHKDVMVATHSDMYNEDESVHYPKIETEATDEQTKEHVGVMGEKTVIIDKVYYENLLADHEYEITGFLMDKDTKEIYLDADGKEVHGTTGKFTVAEGEETGYKEVRFEFNGANLEGKTIVVFEDLHHEGVNIERHYDIEDENQTVHYPRIRTRAFNRLTGTQLLKKDEPAIISDTIYYENLVPGLEYIITGTIYDAETGKEIEGIVGQTKITPTELTGKGEVTIEFDANALAGKPYVFKEVLSIMVPNADREEEVIIFTHFDINDLDETFYIPEIGTTAVSNRNEKFIATEDKQVIVDTLSYKGMKPGSTNIAVLTVFDKTLDRVLTEIEPVKKEFIADESGIGTVEVEVTVNGAEYAGHDLVMFEEVYTKPDDIETPARDWEKYPIAEHKDKDDEGQTIHVPKIGTNASLADTEEDITTHMTRIKDTVSYTNLIPGVEYTLEARGINPETGKATVNEKGEEYVFTKTFTPTEPNGEVVVEMVFKQSDIIGTEIVAFEKLFVEYGLEGQFEVTNHEDPTDENQTVELYQSVKITVIKKSAGTMYPLKGAEISIFNSKGEIINDRFNKPAVGITDEKGTVTFEIFAYKNETYYAQETKAPAGYHLNTNKFELVRDENGNLKAEIDLEILDQALIIPPTPVKTGDETNIALWALLLTLSLLGVAIVQKRRLSAE